jgi:hypothetical protein
MYTHAMAHQKPDREILSPLDRTRETLESIKYTVEAALQLIDDSKRTRSLRWKCENCRNVRHYTKPMAIEAVSDCPKCWGRLFEPCK